MPFLTISTLLLLSGVFCGGCLAAWWVTDRRHERQRALLEESMTRALEQRYHVYEDLEQSFHRVFSRLDEMKASWAQASESTATSMPEHTLMRVDNPELWDLEREYERRLAEQLAEISDKSRRVVELMDKNQALEPLALKLAERDREFVQVEENQRALEETRRARVAELSAQLEGLGQVEDQVRELESQLERAGQDVREWREKHDSLLLQHTEDQSHLKQEIVAFTGRLEEHQVTVAESEHKSAERIETLVAELAERNEHIQQAAAELEELKSQVESRDSQVFMRDELVNERDKQVAEIAEELARTRTERDRKIEELAARDARLEELESAWSDASGEVATQRSKLRSQMSSFEAAQSMLAQLKPMLNALESNLTLDEQAAVDGTNDALPEVLAEPAHAEDEGEPASALPIEDDELEQVEMDDQEFDLSVLDGEECDFDALGDEEK